MDKFNTKRRYAETFPYNCAHTKRKAPAALRLQAQKMSKDGKKSMKRLGGKIAKAQLSSEEDVFDVDPEDLDPSASLTAKMLKMRANEQGQANKHLEDVGKLRRRAYAGDSDDDMDRYGEKYRGIKKSRRDLGFDQPAEPTCDELDEEMSEILFKNKDGPGSEEEDIMKELVEIEKEEARQPAIFANRQVSAVEEGRALRAQLTAWSTVMEIRARLQPLVAAVNRLPDGRVMRKLFVQKGVGDAQEGARKILIELAHLQTHGASILEGCSLKRLWHIYLEPSHNALMSEARNALDRLHLQSVTRDPSSKQRSRLQIINQSAWAQVQLALRDRSRLVKRSQKRRLPGTPFLKKVGQDGTDTNVFDDNDFFSTLMRDWAVSLGATAALLSQNGIANTSVLFSSASSKGTKKPTDSRSSKGRKLKFDVHPLLAGLVAPRRDAHAWMDERIGELCRSLLGGATAVCSAP